MQMPNAPVPHTLHELLIEEDQISLPGIGTLRLEDKPAMVDLGKGLAAPPTRVVTFNQNLTLDDGRLLAGLTERRGMDRADAEAHLNDYLGTLREQLDAGRSVQLEGIGRLFKQYDGVLKFSASEQNFSKRSFGLAPVPVKPIPRTEKAKRAAVDPFLAATPTPPPRKRDRLRRVATSPRSNRVAWYFVYALLVLLGLLALFYIGRAVVGAFAEEEDPVALRDREVYVPPRREPTVRRPVVDADEVDPREMPSLDEFKRRENASGAAADAGDMERPLTESTTETSGLTDPTATDPLNDLPPSTPPVTEANEALIATGLYGSPANVRKNVRRLEEAGYEAFSLPEGSYTRVGARVRFRDDEELFNVLAQLRGRFAEEAFILRKNGESMPIN